MKTLTVEHLNPVPLSEDFDILERGDYSIIVERGDLFLVEFPVESIFAAARFTHPNIARSCPTTLCYKYDSPKRWVEKAGVTHYFVVPRSQISITAEKGYSWPHGEIAGQKVRFNCCGGTGGKGWRDCLQIHTSVNTNHKADALAAVAEVAVRGSGFEPIRTAQEIEDAFYAENAGKLHVVSACGDWHQSVPKGMVGVAAVIDGNRIKSRDRKWFLVPAEEYAKRSISFIINPEKHPEIAPL